MNKQIILISIIVLWLLAYRISFKLIKTEPIVAMFYCGVILTIWSFWVILYQNKLDKVTEYNGDIIGILMLGISTLIVDALIIYYGSQWYNMSIMNVISTSLPLLLAIFIFVKYFGDQLSMYQYIWISICIIWYVLILYR